MIHPDNGILFSAKRSKLSSHEKDMEEKYLFRFSALSFFGWVVCLFAIELHKLFIWETNPLPVALFANIFSRSQGCLSISFMFSLLMQKLLSLIRSHLLISIFIFLTLKRWVKKDFAVIYVKECSACVFL